MVPCAWEFWLNDDSQSIKYRGTQFSVNPVFPAFETRCSLSIVSRSCSMMCFSHTHVLCYFHSRHDTLILFRRVWKSPRNGIIPYRISKRRAENATSRNLHSSMFGCCKASASWRPMATQESAPASQSRVSGSDGCQVHLATSHHLTSLEYKYIFIYIYIYTYITYIYIYIHI